MTALSRLPVALALCGSLDATRAARKPDEEHAHHHSDERTASERAHLTPDPPQHPMGDMSEKDMVEMMDMDDEALFGMVAFDQLEWRDPDGGDAVFWDGRAWFGNDYDKALLKTEGERFEGDYEGSAELLWDH